MNSRDKQAAIARMEWIKGYNNMFFKQEYHMLKRALVSVPMMVTSRNSTVTPDLSTKYHSTWSAN